MKKIMLVLLMAVVSLTTVYAGDEVVAPEVLHNFNKEFAGVREVKWTKSDELYKAFFSLYGQQVCAFYATDGDFLALVRNLSIMQLPIQLIKPVRQKADQGYRVTHLFEMSTNDGTSYYVALENADTIKILQSSGGNRWTVFKKKKKK